MTDRLRNVVLGGVRISAALLCSGGVAAFVAAPAAAASTQAQGDFASQAAALVEASFPAAGPGAAIVVARDGRLIYAGGRGMSDVQNARPITPDTVFALGSIAKQFIAATVLKLIEEGKISLDDPISRFLPDWPQPNASATVRQLLNHTSGIQDFSKVPGWIAANRTRQWTIDQLVAVSRALPPSAAPGTAWEYNNGGYVLLTAIVERASGQTFDAALAQRIARPLGLTTVAYGSDAAARAAQGYERAAGGQQPVTASRIPGLVVSARDFVRFAEALHGGRLLSPASYREMVRPARLADGSTRPYGFGLRLQQLSGRPILAHGGAGAGLDTDSLYLPADKLFVAVLANSENPQTDPGVLTRRLAALAIGRPFPTFQRAQISDAAVQPLLGAYRAQNGRSFLFSQRDGRLFLGPENQQMEVVAGGDDRFFVGPNNLMWVRFERDPAGAHVLLVHRPDLEQPQRAVRAGDAPAPLAVSTEVLRPYQGSFQTETVLLRIALNASGELTVSPPGQSPQLMRPISSTEFRVEGTPMRIVFHPENGRVDRITIHRGARQLNGRRVQP